ncbi:hypothetical protein MJN54_35885, partial [Salmonella enterica subsp. enterica serovar Kentucky]|nr:hypothetical protein [Salmonella enterica subsp. enterica serovar Kentucky]
KELARRWKPEILAGFTKQGTHQAMDDIRESVAELAYYREHFIPRDWQGDAAQWRAGEMNLANWCQQLLTNKAIVPLIHHWLII